ncbi:hypothetical protein CCL21_16305 [Pseudomonas syringae]|nr:hypothetical protein CCL21_16305 [Pseudomonas syringae]
MYLTTIQRGNALRDAPRHRSAPRHTIRIGRRASRTACPRGAWARWCLPGHLARYPFRDLPDDYRSSRSSVGTPCVTLRVTYLRRTAHVALSAGKE